MKHTPAHSTLPGILAVASLCFALVPLSISGTALVPEIHPVVDTARLLDGGVDAEALEHYVSIRDAAELEPLVRNASDFASVVYIDPSASTNGSGASPEDPFDSWTRVTIASGTAYLQKAGTEEVIPSLFDNVPADVLFGAYGEGPRPILSTSSQVSGDQALIRLSNASTGVVIRDLHLRAPNLAACINLRWSREATIYNNELENASWSIRVFRDDHKILGNIIHTITFDGIFIEGGSDIEIGWNLIFRVNERWEPPHTPENIAFGDGIQLLNVGNWHVHHNVIDRSSAGNKFCLISNYTNADYAGTGLLEHNYLIGPRAGPDGGATIFFGSVRAENPYVVRYNKFVRGQVATLWHTVANLVVYGNIFADNAGSINNNGIQTRYYNNVFWNFSGEIMRNGGRLANNIIDNRRSGNTLPASMSFNDHNLFTTTVVRGGNNNILGDPAFVDAENGDFRLTSGSPAINAGMVVTEPLIAVDRAGTPVPQGDAPDIGAFEYVPEMAGVPAFPTGVQANPRELAVIVSWDPVDGATGYEVWRRTGAETEATRVATTDTPGFTDTDLTDGEFYLYQITAVNQAGASLRSVPVGASPRPPRTDWAGFDLIIGSWIDTEEWLGPLNVAEAPWLYSTVGEGWMYIPEEFVTMEGSWLFAPRSVHAE